MKNKWLIAGVWLIAAQLVCQSALAADAEVEFGVEDDLTVLGTEGTSADADMEVKGYTVFGSSGAGAATVTSGAGNVYIDGSAELGTDLHVQGDVAVTGSVTAASFVGDGSGLTSVSSTPSGAAGGDLTGFYPDPTIAPDAVGSAEIATGAVGSGEIATDAVDSAEIAADAVTSSEIAAGAVGASEIATDAVGSDEIAANAVQAAEIDTGAVGSDEIAAGAVDTDEIAAGAVTVAKLDTTVDTRYVNADGDTMSGALALPAGGLTVGTDQVAVTAGGNVGVGTNAPLSKLEVVGATAAGSYVAKIYVGSDLAAWVRKKP